MNVSVNDLRTLYVS